jgi:hypothetical protein
MIDEGRPVYVLQLGNDEKDSVGLGPAETRDANNIEAGGRQRSSACEVALGGGMGYISAARCEQVTMIFHKPEIMFFPDWYIHYVGIGTSTAWAHGGRNGRIYFLQEMTWGSPLRGARVLPPYRPYRPREGGEGNATQNVDITATLDVPRAILELKTSNRRCAMQNNAEAQEGSRQ